jgi:hypothetical protein
LQKAKTSEQFITVRVVFESTTPTAPWHYNLSLFAQLVGAGGRIGFFGERQMAATNTRGLSAGKLRDLARTGAEVALKKLRAEIIAIERTFPELCLSQRRRELRRTVKTAARRTRTMSAAARKAASQRMKRYWAERRKAQAKVK